MGASSTLQSDQALVLEMVIHDAAAYKFAAEELRADKDRSKMAVSCCLKRMGMVVVVLMAGSLWQMAVVLLLYCFTVG